MKRCSDAYKNWDGICHECDEETTSWTISIYSTKMICWNCKDKETKKSDYQLELWRITNGTN